MKLKFFLPFILFILNNHIANATIVQILHTNDTHSFLDSAPHNESVGGAARLKSLMDYYKDKMKAEGIKTLAMDAGDFAEGNLFYMADKGKKVFEVHNEMGYDAGVLGNHDYLMGSADLDNILGSLDLKFSLLGANIQPGANYKNLKSKIKPYKEFEIDGIKIAVLGLTTNELFYTWRLQGGAVTNPYKVAKQYEKTLKSRKNDFIIALTHIGVLNDIKLAERTKYIDLIVGGHSHTTLVKPTYGINKLKNPVPIVQAGKHTRYLGRLLVDLVAGRPLKIISYELIPVKYEAEDAQMKLLVEEANNDLDNTYGKNWLEEKIGVSKLQADDKEGAKKWAFFITDAIKEKSHADVAIHTPSMNGDNFPVGDINRRKLFNSIPRVLDLTEKYGWNIYTANVRGVWLKTLFQALSHIGQPLSFSGITLNGKEIFINGSKVDLSKFYTVAFTEGVIRGAASISQYTRILLRHPENTNFLIWNTLEEKVVRDNGELDFDNLDDKSHILVMPDLNEELRN